MNQIEISVPVTRADLGDPDGWKSGTGDLGVGVKHTLRHDLARGSILSVGGELVLPTGDEAKGFGKGTTVFESFIMFGKLLPREPRILSQWEHESGRCHGLHTDEVIAGRSDQCRDDQRCLRDRTSKTNLEV